MAKKILKSIIVLQEVYDELSETGGPVDVICAMDKSCKTSDVIKFLIKTKYQSNRKRIGTDGQLCFRNVKK
jgi:hypothetical protein